jgi:ABC-type multidrug transport system permease subunit
LHWRILRTLSVKEVQRHAAQRGGIVLALLLVAASLLMTLFHADGSTGAPMLGGIETCYIDIWRDDAWVQHLRSHVPADMVQRIKFRYVFQELGADQVIHYPQRAGAIQMRPIGSDDGAPRVKIWLWHPDDTGSGMAPFEAWFWRESARFFQKQAAEASQANALQIEVERSQLHGGVETKASLVSALVLFALFLSCVYLMPSLMCEERERGILLAQALSPASALEILGAKLLFYPVAGIVLGGAIAGIAKPVVLIQPFFWLALTATACGSLGIGLTIASVARTQRAASMGALCYMFMLALFLFICQQGKIPALPWLALEYHSPRMLHAALAQSVQWFHWVNLGATTVLAIGWLALATILFCKRGWQN